MSLRRTDTATLVQDMRAVFSTLKRRMRDQADTGDLTPSQRSVLLRLEKDGPSTASALARVEGMRPQSIAPVLAVLDGLGWIRAAPDPSDGRQTLLSLSDTCRKWITQGRAAREDWLTRTIEARLTADEREQLAVALTLLQRLANE